jgi:hypothetical protein
MVLIPVRRFHVFLIFFWPRVQRFAASAGARWGIEADGAVAYLPVGFRQALVRTPAWGWTYANRVGRIDASGTLRPALPPPLPAAAAASLIEGPPLAGGHPLAEPPGELGLAGPTGGDGFTPAFRAKLAYNRALFGADLPLLSLYRALTGT